jgi:hypothetical protein
VGCSAFRADSLGDIDEPVTVVLGIPGMISQDAVSACRAVYVLRDFIERACKSLP